MDLYESPNGRRRSSRHDQTVNAIVDFRYLAPAKLARDEAQERMRVEAAQAQFVNGNKPMIGKPKLTVVVRHRLGGILILIGTGLQGAHAASSVVPSAAGLGPAGK